MKIPKFNKEEAAHWFRTNGTIVFCAAIAIMGVVAIATESIMNAGITLFCCLAAGMGFISMYERQQTYMSLSTTQHLHHTVAHTMTYLSHQSVEPMTPMQIARCLADELVVEGLIKMDDYEMVKHAILKLLDDNMTDEDHGYFDSNDVEEMLSRYIKV